MNVNTEDRTSLNKLTQKERKILRRASTQCADGWDLVLVFSEYIGSHSELDHGGEIIVLAIPSGTVIPRDFEFAMSHGTHAYPFGSPNVVAQIPGALAWFDRERRWVNAEEFATMTSYRQADVFVWNTLGHGRQDGTSHVSILIEPFFG